MDLPKVLEKMLETLLQDYAVCSWKITADSDNPACIIRFQPTSVSDTKRISVPVSFKKKGPSERRRDIRRRNAFLEMKQSGETNRSTDTVIQEKGDIQQQEENITIACDSACVSANDSGSRQRSETTTNNTTIQTSVHDNCDTADEKSLNCNERGDENNDQHFDDHDIIDTPCDLSKSGVNVLEPNVSGSDTAISDYTLNLMEHCMEHCIREMENLNGNLKDFNDSFTSKDSNKVAISDDSAASFDISERGDSEVDSDIATTRFVDATRDKGLAQDRAMAKESQKQEPISKKGVRGGRVLHQTKIDSAVTRSMSRSNSITNTNANK